MANSPIIQGDNSVIVIDDKDTINKTKNVTVEKTVNIEKVIDTSALEAGQEVIVDELVKIRKSLEKKRWWGKR